MKAVGFRALTVALLAVSVHAGADHDVMQVKSPYVVKYPLGPLMEVQGKQPAGHSPSARNLRNANAPRYGSECFSCSTGSFSSSDYGSSGGYSSGTYNPGSYPGSSSYVAPQTSSSRHEFRREQQYVNGQPIYELHHERRFQDGNLVHEEKVEKDEDDFGVSQSPVASLQNQAAGSYNWYTQPGYSKSWEESRHENYTYGYGGGTGSENQGSDEFSSNFNAEVSRLREQLHRQMGTFRSQPQPAAAGSSYRTEVHSQTRYVNGQPIYVKNEEKKYQDGRLVHNRTEEKGAAELGTAELERHYDSNGALIGGGAHGGYYENRQYHENRSQYGDSYYPSSSYYNGNHRPGWDASQVQSGSHSSVASSQTSSSRQETRTDYRPTYDSSTQSNQEHRRYSAVPSYSTSYGRNSLDSQRQDYIPSSYPSHRETPNQGSYYSQETREQSSSYPSYRPNSASSTAHTREDSYSGSLSSHSSRPTVDSSTSRFSHESRASQPSYPVYRPSSSSSGAHHSRSSLENSSVYSSYNPSSSSSSQVSRENTRESTSSPYPTYRPITRGSTQQRQEYYEDTSSHQYQQPSVGSTSVHNSGETHRASSYYPSHRPSSVSSTSRVSEETRRTTSHTPSSGSYSPSYPSYRPSEDRQSTSYAEERQSSSLYSASESHTDGQEESSSEDIEETRVLQNTRDSSLDDGTNYATHVNQQSLSQESSRDYDQYHRPARPGTSGSLSSSQSTDRRYGSQEYGSYGYPSPVGNTDGGARTVAIDLSSSSKSDSTLTDQLLGSGQSARRYGAEAHRSSRYGEEFSSVQERERERSSSQSLDQHARPRQPYSSRDNSPVGIPGVISGPQSSQGDGNYDNKERYDISPLDDGSPQLPEVGNEIDSSLIPTMPSVEGEVDSSDLYLDHSDGSLNQNYAPQDESNEDDDDHDISSGAQHSRVTSQSSYQYNDTHTVYGTPLGQQSSTADRSIYDYSRSSTADESRRAYPASSGSSRYHYNETRRHSTIIGGQQNSYPSASIGSSTLTSDCTQVSGCGAGATSSSRRSEIRTSKRYINGQLVGITHYERLYENGRLVHENVTEQGVDELTPEELRKYGIDQLNLVQGSYQPGSYSQRHEVRQEKKYVNGQQVYDLHHERQFEDGQLVHENRTEKDEDDFRVSPSDSGYHGAGFSSNLYDEANRHEVTQSQHLQQHVTSEARPGSVGRSSQTHQVADTSRVITKPVYTSRRQETRRQQEYINGQPVYDLHHERRYHDGSLVYENRTELDEKELGGPSGGHYDALHQIMSGNTLNTAYESTYGKNELASGGSSSHSSGSQSTSSATGGSTSYGGSSAGRGSGSYSASSATRGSGSYSGSSGTRGSGSYDESSSTSSSTHESSQSYETSGGFGSSLLTSGGPSLTHSGGARTTVLGTGSSYPSGSHGTSSANGDSAYYSTSSGARGSGSYSTSSATRGSGSYGGSSGTRGSGSYEESSSTSSSTHDRSQSHGTSGGFGTSLLTSGGSSLTHSGGARTTVLDTGFARGGSSSRQYESSYDTSQESSSGNTGCLTCVLLGSSGHSGSSHSSSAAYEASHGYSGSLGGGVSDGYNRRREMSREEYYEDGKLIHGREEDRSFRDGQLIQENRRQYSDIPGQYSNAEEFQSAGTSYASQSSSGASSHSSVYSSASEEEQDFGARVTVKGDDTGVCETSPCLNGGTCVSGLRGPICVCSFGFKGTRCEEVYCPRRFCRYGGTCTVEDGKHDCSCKSGFSGPRCQIRTRRHASRP